MRLGWDLRETENGRVAVDLRQKRRPDVVVLDLVMPVIDGMEAVDWCGEFGAFVRCKSYSRSPHLDGERSWATI
jgi:CheY-like chemotaxis protein